MGQLSNMIQEYVFNGWKWKNSSSNSLYKSDQTIAIQRLPVDIFIEILKLLTPKEAARLTCVCKWLNEIIFDYKLWEYFLRKQHSAFFAETKLRYSFPLREAPLQELSFKRIYSDRAKAPRAIIIDGGSGFGKFGWSNCRSPSVRLATPVQLDNNGAPLAESRLHDFLESIYTRMQVSPSAQPVIISKPLFTNAAPTRQSSVDARTILFKMGVPAFCLVHQAILAMFSASRTSGILVNIGYSKTKVFPILNGKIKYKERVKSVGVGGLKLSEYLREQVRQRNLHFSILSNVHLLKEKLCYVALDYEAELLKDTEASHRVGSCSCTLKQERFRTGELLFQPQLAGINERGLHQAVAECINHCTEVKMKSGHNWFKTIVLAGGTARLPGLAERLEKELRDLLPPSVSNGIRVIASPYGADATWHGAKLVSSLSTFTDSWCIKPAPKPKLESTRESTMIFVCLFMVSCFIESMKRKKFL